MKARVKVLVLGLVLMCLASVSGFSEEKANSQSTPSTSGTSLGDIARKLKAEKAKEPKATLVVTNDNIKAVDKGSEIEVAPPPKTPAATRPDTGTTGTPVKDHDEEYYRTQQSKLQDKLETDKRELAVLQQKLGQNNMQYYPDPNQSLQQQYSREDVNKLTADINAKKQQVADDEKALDDLRDQLRREGGDPGWLR